MKLFIFYLLLFIPTVVFSAGGDFVALTPIPGLNTGSGTTLVEYVNGIFTLVISLAAMLAVLRIVTGGFKYMTAEAIGAKGDARETIQGAVFGLILLLGSWLILFTINPTILDLSALKFESLGCKAEKGVTCGEETQKLRAEAEARAKEFIDPKNAKSCAPGGECPGEGTYNTIETTSVGSVEEGIYRSGCRQNGGTVKTYDVAVCRSTEGGDYQGIGDTFGKSASQRTTVPKDEEYRMGASNALIQLNACFPGDEKLGSESYLLCYKKATGN